MKPSRIFLGVTTVLLAIAGIAASGTHRRPPIVRYYYTKIVGQCAWCTKVIITSCFIDPGPICVYKKNGFSYGIYTQGSTRGFCCHTPTRYDPD